MRKTVVGLGKLSMRDCRPLSLETLCHLIHRQAKRVLELEPRERVERPTRFFAHHSLFWVNVYGNVCALISGVGVVHGELGDVINANEERWHRATSCPNTGKSIRMAMTPRSKEGQVHHYQIDQRPGGQ